MKNYILALKRYADFKGKSSRAEFWHFFLVNYSVTMVASFFGVFIGFPLLGFIYALATIIPNLAVGVRRMHDVGKSGWFFLIPFYNLYLAIQNGESDMAEIRA